MFAFAKPAAHCGGGTGTNAGNCLMAHFPLGIKATRRKSELAVGIEGDECQVSIAQGTESNTTTRLMMKSSTTTTAYWAASELPPSEKALHRVTFKGLLKSGLL